MSVPRTATSEEVTPGKRPSLDDTARLFQGPLGIRSLSLSGIFLLACFYTLYFARDFFLPVILAVVLNFLFAPVVRVLKQFRVPEALSAALMITAALALFGVLAYEFSGPLAEWLEKAPQTGAQLQKKFQPLRKYVEKMSVTSEQVEKLASTKPENEKAPPRVELKKASLLDILFSGTSKLVFTLLVVLVLLYFLLASGDLFLAKLVHVLPTLSDKKKAVQIAREIEGNISQYLLTMTLINTGVSILAGLLFWAFGMPNPALWGAMAGLLNFIPTIGSLSMAVILTLVATTAFPSLLHALLVPAAFLTLTILVGTFVSPLIVGRRLTLNPVVIFLGLSFWGWLWGIPGALLAVPMLAMFKIFCDHIEPLAPLGEFLGQ
jgi:predicted PurR-regulated permease PerM